MRTATTYGVVALVLALSGCAQNTEQPVAPTQGVGTGQELPQDTSNRHFLVFNVNGGLSAETLDAVLNGDVAKRALGVQANGVATTQPIRLKQADELGGYVEVETPGASRSQVNNFILSSQADSQQGATTTADQRAEAALEASQEIKSAVEILLDLQLQWQQTIKVLSELTDALKAQLASPDATPAE